MARVIKENDVLILRDDWDEDDIRSVAECDDIELTDGMVEEVMHLLAKEYDTNDGLNWGIVSQAIDQVIKESIR